jgi:hypothetical protein
VVLRSARGSVKVAEALFVSLARSFGWTDRARLVSVDSSAAARDTRRVEGVRSRISQRDRSRGATGLGSELSLSAGAGLVPIARGESNQGRQRYAVRRNAEEVPRSAELLKGSARTAEAGCRR